MKKLLVITCLVSFASTLFSQSAVHVKDYEAPAYKENVTVSKIANHKHQSTFIIWVADTVKPHYHADHTESIYVEEGEGRMYLGGEMFVLKTGDYLLIPAGVIHSFKNTGQNRCKVISIQSPEFTGKDRIWVEKQE